MIPMFLVLYIAGLPFAVDSLLGVEPRLLSHRANLITTGMCTAVWPVIGLAFYVIAAVRLATGFVKARA